MTRTAVIHIGTEKTGTTTIQHFLRLNRKRLREQGIFVPETLGPITHTWLATLAEDDEASDDEGPQNAAGANATTKAARGAAFAAEISALPAGVTRAAFSSEHLHRRLRTLDEVRRLRTLLAPYFERFRIIVYLRRQDRLAASLYSTKIKYGATWDLPILPSKPARDSHYYNYQVLLEKYIAVFGREAIVARIFEPKHLLEGNVLKDYCAAAEIDMGSMDIPKTKNPSLSAAALLVLSTLNSRAPERGDVLIRENFVHALEQHCGSSKQILPRHEAVAFHQLFQESNAWVRDNFFPDASDALFDEDFSHYPDIPERLQPSTQEVLAVIGHLWDAQREQRQASRERVLKLEARLHAAGLGPEPGAKRQRKRERPVRRPATQAGAAA